MLVGGIFKTYAYIWKLALLLLLPSAIAIAQEQPADDDLDQQYQKARAAMMAAPKDPERAFEFTQIAVKYGDLRGAIAALERILLLKPNLANIQLELGLLYLRVGAPEMAELYLRQAIASPELPLSVRKKAEGLLAQAQARVSRHLFTGSLFLGGVYDTNATAAPSSRRVRARGQVALLDEADTGDDDISAVFYADTYYAYALDSQIGNLIEANLLLYARRYDESDEINLLTGDLDVGPRFFFGPVLNPTLSIRPFISGTYLTLDDEDYLYSFGVGINIRKFFSFAWYGELTVKTDFQSFEDSSTRQTVSDQSGPLTSLQGSLNYQLFPSTLLSANGIIERRSADEDYESLTRGGLTLEVTQSYAAPFGITTLPWSTSLSAGFLQTAYDEPDPAVDPDKEREETRLSAALTTNIRMAEAWTLTLGVQYTDNDANLPNFEYDNTSVSLGVAWRF